MNLIFRRALLMLSFLLLMLSQLVAQNYVEIGTGTVANTMPVYSYWNYSWSSLIYNHTDLGAAKSITKIALNCTNGPKTVTNQKIYYKLTSNTVFANANYEDPLNSGYTLIYSGDLSFVNGWNEITLITPIPYDGVQNIAMHWEDRWGNTYGPVFNSTTSAINNNKNCGNDSFFPLPTQTGYLNPYPSALPNMRFYYAGSGPATPASPVPADNATVVSVSTTLSWVLGANTTSYDLYFGTNPQNLPLVVSNAPAGAGTYSYTPPAILADSTMHYWKVVAKNGTQQEASPVWKFKTEVVIDQFPYYEGFEDSLVFHTYPVVSAWVIEPDISWYQYDTLQHSGALCAKTSWYTSGNQATIRSPKVLLPPNYSISYFWRNTNANKVAGHDTTYFEITTNGGQSWIKLDTLSPATVNAVYVQRTVNLGAYAGNNFYFRFRHVTDLSGSASNVYLDDISIVESGSSPALIVTPPNQNVTSATGSTQFSVASNSAWSVSSDQTWCTVTPSGSGNGTVTATYTENTELLPRVASITVTVAGLSPVIVTVTQDASAPFLGVTPPNQDVSFQSGTTNFSVNSNLGWSAVSDAGWCAVTSTGTGAGTLFATYAENNLASVRIAHITVTASGLAPIVVTVTQSGPAAVLGVTPAIQTVTYPTGLTTFAVTSNASWTATSDAAWCVPTASGTGSGVLVAVYEQNASLLSRTAHITVSAAGVSPVIVEVIQQPSTVGLSEALKNAISVSPNPSNGIISINYEATSLRNAVLELYNTGGNLVYSELFSAPTATVDLSFLSKGIYILRINSEDSNVYTKLILQ